ncbi:hypothetical protein VTK26DRAFT_1507 [Humicola hyalothermophila]
MLVSFPVLGPRRRRTGRTREQSRSKVGSNGIARPRDARAWKTSGRGKPSICLLSTTVRVEGVQFPKGSWTQSAEDALASADCCSCRPPPPRKEPTGTPYPLSAAGPGKSTHEALHCYGKRVPLAIFALSHSWIDLHHLHLSLAQDLGPRRKGRGRGSEKFKRVPNSGFSSVAPWVTFCYHNPLPFLSSLHPPGSPPSPPPISMGSSPGRPQSDPVQSILSISYPPVAFAMAWSS